MLLLAVGAGAGAQVDLFQEAAAWRSPLPVKESPLPELREELIASRSSDSYFRKVNVPFPRLITLAESSGTFHISSLNVPYQ